GVLGTATLSELGFWGPLGYVRPVMAHITSPCAASAVGDVAALAFAVSGRGATLCIERPGLRRLAPAGSHRHRAGTRRPVTDIRRTHAKIDTDIQARAGTRPSVVSGAILPHSSRPRAHIHTPCSPVTPQTAKNTQVNRPGC